MELEAYLMKIKQQGRKQHSDFAYDSVTYDLVKTTVCIITTIITTTAISWDTQGQVPPSPLPPFP